MSLRLAITSGDYNGIGPEIVLKSCAHILNEGATPVVLGNKKLFEKHAEKLDLGMPENVEISRPGEIKDGLVNFVHLTDETPEPSLGKCTKQAGRFAMQSVEKGINWCVEKHTQALVTAPISKEAVNKAGYHIPGHTEFLAQKTHSENFMMLLVQDQLRVGLVTIHIPVADVAQNINTARVLKNIEILNRTLRIDFGIAEPRIAVLGLNPHAGDGGVIGREEIKEITPAIVQAETEGVAVSGPHPADGFFGNRKYEQYDAVLAMYHDQGLVPFKTLAFGGGVNVTAGLPIIRTSPDHGTAFDIAGQNKADPSSLLKAAQVAQKLSQRRFNVKAKAE